MAFQTTFISPRDAKAIATYSWGEEIEQPRGIVQIAHGLAEHAPRYDRLAQALVEVGFRVIANDHRGHGATASIPEELGELGAEGISGLAQDIADIGAATRETNPNLKIFLLGHSMGSIASQETILTNSDLYAGLVLSGSTSVDVLAANLSQGEAPAGLEAFNASFEQRTGYEWLSRDETEVDKYVEDPLCGFVLPEETVPAIFSNAAALADAGRLQGIRSDLPILIISGQRDPLSGDGQLVNLLGQRYRDAGVQDVTVKVYPEARHEVFNETNRDEITQEVIRWLTPRS